MPRQSSQLFTHRRATREFLLSRSNDQPDFDAPAAVSGEQERTECLLLKTRFPDMLDRQGLLLAIDNHLASAAGLCAIAAKIEAAPEEDPQDDQCSNLQEEAVIALAAFCRKNGGILACVGLNRFVCVFGHLPASDGQALAQDLLAAYSDLQDAVITIGVAGWPTLDFARRQVVENAEKALEHAGFLGAGSVAGFDAISLNISGDRRYQSGDIVGAIDEFKLGLRLDPDDANLHNSLGVCFGVLKEYEDAQKAFERAIRLAPQDVMAIYNKGFVHLLDGRRQAALQCFLEADAVEPDVFEVVFHIGQTLMETGAAKNARPYLETATAVNCRSGAAFRSLGACLNKLDLTKEAIQAYKSAVKINPEDAESLSILGGLYTRRGESLDVATVLCEQSVRLAPDSGLFRHRLGTVYLNRDKLDMALVEFEQAVALGHDSQPQIEATRERLMAARAS
jgi:Flp pilus assembly protein TadD